MMKLSWSIGIFALSVGLACGAVATPEAAEADGAAAIAPNVALAPPAELRAAGGHEAMAAGRPDAPSAEAAALRRKIILTGRLTVEVDHFAEKAESLRTAIRDLGGYASGSEERVDDAERRHGSLTFRIPTERWSQALAAARALGKVLEETTHGQDVSEEYYDLEARLAVDRRFESELMELLDARRGRLSDLLEVKREIARVRSEIESKEGRRRFLANMVSLSTLTVHLQEPKALVRVKPGAWDPILEALGDAAGVLAGSLGVIVLAAAALAPWIGLGWLMLVIVRRRWRRRRNSSATSF